MTHVLHARNVNGALSDALHYLVHHGTEMSSRNGPVLVAPGPVITEYTRPLERVLFSPQRNANPFFHLMEALWMLAGRNDVEWPALFNKHFTSFSDDGVTAWGAYGWRWRSFFGYDQLKLIANELRARPDSRRAVLGMWNAAEDTAMSDGTGARTPWGSFSDLEGAIAGGRDVPCNTNVYFDRIGEGGALNMTVCCRSNDIIWGAYGANAVHFSILQEYMAAAIGCPVGVYRQFSNNWHMYTELYPQIVTRQSMQALALDASIHDDYRLPDMRPFPLVSTELAQWDEDLREFMGDPMGDTVYADPFFGGVAAPMYTAWYEWKQKDLHHALTAANHIIAPDWRQACVAWLERRKEALANG